MNASHAIDGNATRDEIHIAVPAGQQLVVVNTITNVVTDRRNLGYTPSNAVWLGIKR